MIGISIVVPVYNVEGYLEQCVKSVLSQTYRNYELILVDDGSTDGSPGICDDFAGKDNRVKVLHKENGGASSARNEGINASSGEFVTFLDSDDYWDGNFALSEIMNTAEQSGADVIIWGWKKLYDKTGRISSTPALIMPERESELTKPEFLSFLVKESRYNPSACDKAIKRSLLSGHKLYFEEGFSAEDIVWALKVAVNAKSFALCKKDIYVYRQRTGSVTGSVSEKNVLSAIKNTLECCNDVLAIKEDNLRGALAGYAAEQYANMLIIIGQSEKMPEHIKQIRPYEFILDSAVTFRAITINKVRKTVGLRITTLLLRVAYGCLKLLRIFV